MTEDTPPNTGRNAINKVNMTYFFRILQGVRQGMGLWFTPAPCLHRQYCKNVAVLPGRVYFAECRMRNFVHV